MIIISQVISHERFSRADYKCDSSENYSFYDCIMRKISKLNGCQTFWTSYPNIPHCWNETKLLSFINLFWKYYDMEKYDLSLQSGCTDPCNYMEYKVTLQFLLQESNKIFLQLVGNPTRVEATSPSVSFIYANSAVYVEKEEWTFSFTSLVADCCGILGVFIGFNFLMVWDLLLYSYKYFKHRHDGNTQE